MLSPPFPARTSSNVRKTILNYSSDSHRNDPLSRNKQRTDVLNFLTQRAVQSFIFLMISCRDPHTGTWLERNIHSSNLESFHGTGAFNMTLYPEWDSVLKQLLSQPPEVVIIQARRRGKGHGGWSKDNPYMEHRFVEFEIDIDPPSLVSRIVSVRQQLASEFQVDLDSLLKANDEILSSYFDRQVTARDDKEGSEMNTNDPGYDPDIGETDTSFNINNQNSLGGDGGHAFVRNAMVFVRDAIAFEEHTSSPLRKGNFDLICLLATQESVHRVLRAYADAGEEREVSKAWLRDFYTERVKEYFDGHQKVGRSDDFLEALLLTPPAFRDLDTTGQRVGLIDPIRISEDLIRMRSEVVLEWKEILEDVPAHHMELQRLLLAQRMNPTSPKQESLTFVPEEESDTFQ